MKLLSSVYSQATILVHLIKNFALMSNLEAYHELGEFRDKPDKIDVLLLCINLANDFQPQAAENGDKTIDVDEKSFRRTLGIREFLIVKNLVAQAISNLLENAVKYSNAGTSILIAANSSPDGIGIAIRSVGLPVDAAESACLCERGYRGVAAKKKKFLLAPELDCTWPEGLWNFMAVPSKSCPKAVFPRSHFDFLHHGR